MAHKRTLNVMSEGMSFIWNIDDKVGTQTSEANSPDDVTLVSLLFNLGGSASGQSAAPGCRAKPQINGQMNHALGFWIYFSQVEAKSKVVVDGYLSPMKFINQNLLIYRLNYLAMKNNKTAWENLPNHPQCPPSLKAKLLAPPKTN